MKCTGRFCTDAKVKRQVGRGSFAGWILHVCAHCGQIVRMTKQ